MRRIIALLIVIILICMLAACSVSPQTLPAENTASASVQPSRNKELIEDMFGKKIKVAAVSNTDEAASEWFFSGVNQEAQALGVEVQTKAAQEEYETQAQTFAKSGVDAIIVFLYNPVNAYDKLEAIANEGIPICIFELKKGGTTKDISQIYYNTQTQEDMAINAALSYPPHDAPVRLLSMFNSKTSKVYTTYESFIKQGMIFFKRAVCGI